MEWIGSLVSGKSQELKAEEEKPAMTPEEEYRSVVDKLKAWFDTPKDESGCMNKEEFRKRLDAVYDKSFMRYSEGEEEADYERFVQEAMGMAEAYSFDFKLFRYKQGKEPGCMDVYVRYSSKENDVVVEGTYYYKNAMIYKTVVTRSLKKKAPGQVSATDEELAPDLTGKDLARHIHESNSLLGGQQLGLGHGMEPAEERYELLKLKLMYDDKGKKNAMGGLFRLRETIELFDSSDNPYVGGCHFRYARRQLGMYKSLTLFDGHKQAVAFCEKNDKGGFTIFGTSQLVEGDASKRMEDCGDDSEREHNVVAFFPWYRLQKDSSFGDLYFIFVASDISAAGKVEFEPIYKLIPGELGKKRIFTICNYYDDNKTGKNEGSFIGVIRADKKQKHEGKVLETDVAPGVDPAMVLCIAACMEELKNV